MNKKDFDRFDDRDQGRSAARLPFACMLVSLDRLPLVPSELDGSRGLNRFEGRSSIDAGNDLEAIRSWLKMCASPDTRRSYAKEAERLLMWSIRERGAALSSLTADDIQDYFEFLSDPPADWISIARAKRESPDWRPLRGPLAGSSLRQAQTIVNALFIWLVSARYLAGNPCALTRKKGRGALKRPTRYLRRTTWEFLRSWISTMPEETARQAQTKARARHLSALLYLTAARLSDAAGGRMGMIMQEEDGSWWWSVVGKGGKEAMLPATDELMDSLAAYRAFYGLPPRPAPGEKTPLIMRLTGPMAGDALLSDNMVYRMVKSIFGSAAIDAASAGHHEIAANLSAASTHWMRHTALTHQLDAGVDLTTVRDNARHASIATTSIYLWKEDRERHEQTNAKHRLAPEPKPKT